MESLIRSFYLSVAARKIVCADPSLRYTRMLLGREATNQQTNLMKKLAGTTWGADTVTQETVHWQSQTSA